MYFKSWPALAYRGELPASPSSSELLSFFLLVAFLQVVEEYHGRWQAAKLHLESRFYDDISRFTSNRFFFIHAWLCSDLKSKLAFFISHYKTWFDIIMLWLKKHFYDKPKCTASIKYVSLTFEWNIQFRIKKIFATTPLFKHICICMFTINLIELHYWSQLPKFLIL